MSESLTREDAIHYDVFCDKCDKTISSGVCDADMYSWAVENDEVSPNHCKYCGSEKHHAERIG
jgi:hypothetical protein